MNKKLQYFYDFNITKKRLRQHPITRSLTIDKESGPKLSTIQKPHSVAFSLMMLNTEITVWFYCDINVYPGLLNNSFSNS